MLKCNLRAAKYCSVSSNGRLPIVDWCLHAHCTESTMGVRCLFVCIIAGLFTKCAILHSASDANESSSYARHDVQASYFIL